MKPRTFAVIGAAGWRAQFFLQVANALPDRFAVTGMLIRDSAKAQAQQTQWNFPATQSLDELLAAKPDFVVVSVSRTAAAEYIEEIAVRRGIGVLCETPPAPADLGVMNRLWSAVQPAIAKGIPVQVAENYPFQPMHSARIAVARSGRLGPLTHAQASFSHGYHGMALLRRLLGVGIGHATIRAQKFVSKIIQGPNRQGAPAEEKLIDQAHTIATIEFATGQTALFDFAADQHRSWVRSPRVIVRGQRGEVHDDTVRTLIDYRTPAIDHLTRVDSGHEGNMEGYNHRGVQLGGRWVYQNPFGDARLSDDEIAVGHCMANMANEGNGENGGGEPIYTLTDGLHDHYLAMVMDRAIESGTPVSTEPQAWFNAAAATS
ncbi:MAG: oxidoreductase [Phycisphaerales bacterium]|nr:oxidoreductase [Phycisphaerales bacterium]